MLLTVLGSVIGLVSFVCWIVILVDAFKSAIWKGIVGLLCGLYLIYYGLFEFEHENKFWIVLGMIFGGAVATALVKAGS